jgi:hypothetical protein
MLKRFALGPVVIIAALGVIFVGLDILDVVEIYGLPLPVSILNTVFIATVAVLIAYVVARKVAVTTLPQPALWLACGVIALGGGVLLYGWLPASELNVRITIHESTTLIASTLHLAGAVLEVARRNRPKSEFWQKPRITLLCYLVIIAGIAVVTLLSFKDVIPPFHFPDNGSLLRSAVRITTIVFFLAASSIYLRTYSRSQTAFHFWYSLGLLLLAEGSIFLSLSSVKGLIAWIGRVAQYTGGIYLLVAILNSDQSSVAQEKVESVVD